MFLSTLGLGEWQVFSWIKKGTENGIVKKAKSNKTKKKKIQKRQSNKMITGSKFFQQITKIRGSLL